MKRCRMGLTNHTQVILHRLMPPVINAFRDGHTDTYNDLQTKTISRNQACVSEGRMCLV